ncbi:hypothetical protein AOA59_05950 [Pseudomonas sp. 2822-15]|nr:hypothetical protein AOA59_05950 [Pseudomonas sp. 2822-15]
MAKSQSGNKEGGDNKKEDGCEQNKIAHQHMHNKNRVDFSESSSSSNSSSSSTNHINISANISSKAA